MPRQGDGRWKSQKKKFANQVNHEQDTKIMNIHLDNKKLAAELAEALVEDRMGKHMVWEDREDGSEGLTEEAQDVFNDIYEIILTNLESIK